ncbi:hypothetical protein [Actinorugispora endophytica]|uniref:Uncharacterized protein n=1 Tax=Actinorugispora endophytica TaxID=1605990 RepID=A0A4V3D7E5_9ACTN|nr:hypothetical protein [Actinorugispora endophytica]TDQ47577.1 hypothetical protein EV190_12145 [Actinorugispora endophytica]
MTGINDYVALARDDHTDPVRQWTDLMEAVSGVARDRLCEVAALLDPPPGPIRTGTPLAAVLADFERFGVLLSEVAATRPGLAPGVDDRLLAARAELIALRDREEGYAAAARAMRALHHRAAHTAASGPRALLRRRRRETAPERPAPRTGPRRSGLSAGCLGGLAVSFVLLLAVVLG